MWICEKKEFWVRSNGRWERSDTIATAACSVDGKSKATDNQLFRRLPTYLSLREQIAIGSVIATTTSKVPTKTIALWACDVHIVYFHLSHSTNIK